VITPLLQQYVLDHLLMGRVTHIEALELLALLPDASIDAIITDLPYGTTACAWDEVIPFAPMWAGVKRVLKPRGVFVTTASQPFTSALVMSNPAWFRYEWIWDKGRGSNYQLANMMPMKSHENVLVFASESPNYFPQYWYSTPYKTGAGNRKKGVEGLGAKSSAAIFRPETRSDDGRRFPLSIISETRDEDKIHPTQKPVALYRYLVRTYTRPGDLVLDVCCGSATTGMACREEGRRFVLGERDADIAQTAQARLDAPYTVPMFQGVA